MRLWNYKEGKELACINFREHIPKDSIPAAEVCKETTCEEDESKSKDNKEHNTEGASGKEEERNGKEEGAGKDQEENVVEDSTEDNAEVMDKAEGSESRVDVKSMSYCPEEQLLAVAFEGYELVIL